ncbi:MAG: ABC transporter substrate-binding protein [Proteobacteria bacterium]|nr:ABC transporter substrate-binding protein [Pseudomonadota bacterium]
MKKILWLMVLVFSLALAGAAVAAEVQGVTDTSIKIGQWGPQTGPAALWGAVARGTKAYFELINSEGGINGRKIEYFLRDDGYNPNRTKAIAKELYEQEKIWGFACGVGTSPGMAVMPYIIKNNIPWVGMATGSPHWAYPPKKTIFAVYPLYPDEAQILTAYAIDTLGKKKIAFFYQNDDYGKGGLVGAVRELKKRGMTLAADVPVEVGETDLASHVLKMKKAGADCVIMWVYPKHAAIVLGTAAKLGYKPQWMACSTLSDVALMFKITKGLWNGMIFGNFAELADSKAPLMVKYHKAQMKFAPKERWGVFFYAGFGFVEPMVEGIKRAGKDLSADNFVKAMESLKDFKGIMGPITYSAERRQGIKKVFLAKCVPATMEVQGKKITYGKGQRLSDWMGVE